MQLKGGTRINGLRKIFGTILVKKKFSPTGCPKNFPKSLNWVKYLRMKILWNSIQKLKSFFLKIQLIGQLAQINFFGTPCRWKFFLTRMVPYIFLSPLILVPPFNSQNTGFYSIFCKNWENNMISFQKDDNVFLP